MILNKQQIEGIKQVTLQYTKEPIRSDILNLIETIDNLSEQLNQEYDETFRCSKP